jgi:predicted MPP superfamily phosphohydrolase
VQGVLLTRRNFLKLAGATVLTTGAATSAYAFGIEPRFRLATTFYRLTPPGWPAGGRRLRVAVLADIHACEPWMPVGRIEDIVEATNRLEPDIVCLLGDYVPGLRHFRTGIVTPPDWARALAGLSAREGVFAVLGNHDWWGDIDAVRAAFAAVKIPVLENDAGLIEPRGAPAFWLAGLGDQMAGFRTPDGWRRRDDLPGTLAKIGDRTRPVILLAHEPDIFPEVPDRVSLTICGHTHGGQVALPFIGRPVVPSRYGQRYAYGHVVEDGRHLIVSGGLGCSGIPVRFGVPPEIVVIDVGELSGDGSVAI